MSLAENMLTAIQACESDDEMGEVVDANIKSRHLMGVFDIDRNADFLKEVVEKVAKEEVPSDLSAMYLLPFADFSIAIISQSSLGLHMTVRAPNRDTIEPELASCFYRECSYISSKFEHYMTTIATRLLERLTDEEAVQSLMASDD